MLSVAAVGLSDSFRIENANAHLNANWAAATALLAPKPFLSMHGACTRPDHAGVRALHKQHKLDIPSIGSQVSPSECSMPILEEDHVSQRHAHTRDTPYSAAWRICAGVPPMQAVKPALAILVATPTSAIQPPSAALIVAPLYGDFGSALPMQARLKQPYRLNSIPTAAAVSRKVRMSFSASIETNSVMYLRTDGITPQAPAVGATIILPPAALTSLTAIA